jgi:IS5 family transposase
MFFVKYVIKNASLLILNVHFLAFFTMKPKRSPQQNRQANLFRPELVSMINPSHSLVRLSKVVDWEKLDETFGESFCPEKGRPAISKRLMVALHYFKYTLKRSFRAG